MDVDLESDDTAQGESIPLYQVDAFTDTPFAGNPAAVCLYEVWLPDDVLQRIAAENNLSETAFLVPLGEGWELRWFTPTTEVDLCGHATLASAYVLFHEVDPELEDVLFHTKSGDLHVTRDGDEIVLDFPARFAEACEAPPALAEALGATPVEVRAVEHWYLAVFEKEADVAGLDPDMRKVEGLGRSVIATAPGEDGDVDFVSRCFAPAVGVPEDPVTGSAHCTSAPYWAEQLGKRRLQARQISARGGDLSCLVRGDRVLIGGRAVLVLRGELVF